MTRFLLSMVLGVSTALGLLLPLPLSEAAGVAKTLAQTPVTGRLADGGTFQGRLTLQALRFDEDGHMVATGILSGTATPAAGRSCARGVTRRPECRRRLQRQNRKCASSPWRDSACQLSRSLASS